MAALLFQHDQNFSEVQTAKSCDKAMLHAVFVVLFRDSFISTDFTWCIVWMLTSELALFMFGPQEPWHPWKCHRKDGTLQQGVCAARASTTLTKTCHKQSALA